MSCLDLAWVRLGVDPLAAGVRIVDGRQFAVETAGQRGPFLVLQCDQPHVLSEIKLAAGAGNADGDGHGDDGGGWPAQPVTVLQRLGLPDESIAKVAWPDLDQVVVPDHLTSLWVPELATSPARELVRLDELVRTLREQCPWDRRQTHLSLSRHLLEETYEVLDAIEGLDQTTDGVDQTPDGHAGFGHFEEELGDLLFQVYFHAALAREAGQFTLADVARGVHDKLVGRHPHVFGTIQAADAEAVVTNWEQIKRAEKGRDSIMDGIPTTLPALLLAAKIQGKASSVGFDWPDVTGAYPKVNEELDEIRAASDADLSPAVIAEEMGDLLFACVNVARHLGVDPEAALRTASSKFSRRFMAVERLAAGRGIDLVVADLADLDRLWDEVKSQGLA
jgi:tetrapyrrole methylase family protein/MazG family protein